MVKKQTLHTAVVRNSKFDYESSLEFEANVTTAIGQQGKRESSVSYAITVRRLQL